MVAAFSTAAAGPAAAELAVPPLGGRVADSAGILSSTSEQKLEVLLARLESVSGAQVAVLTVPSLEGEPIESYALRVAESWALGSRERDDGALLLVAVGNRRARIEVGEGLEGVLPDIVAGRILREAMAPHFQRGDYDSGTLLGVKRIAELLAPDEAWPALEVKARAPAPRAEPAATPPPEPDWEIFWASILFLLVMPLVGAVYGLFAKNAEARGITFGALLLPILLGASLATDELAHFPADSGKFLLGGAAALILFSALFWWLHFRLRKRPQVRESWQRVLDELASGRILYRVVGKAEAAPSLESDERERWLRRALVTLFYLGIGWAIAMLWHVGHAIFFLHNIFWLAVIHGGTLHPSPPSESAGAWSGRSAPRRSYSASSWRSGSATASSRPTFRGGGGSFGGGGASGSW